MKRGFFDLLRSPVLWAVLAVAASMPLWVPPYYLGIATQTLVFVGLALAWNIVGGLAGQISLAHSLFVGIGALVPSALLISFGLNMWAGMALATLLSAVVGVFIAWVDFRFRLAHLSFALVTLAFAEVGELVVLGSDFLGGASGLYLPPDTGHISLFQFGGSHGYFWVLLVLAAVCTLANFAIINVRLGYNLRAIRGNEDAAQAIGVGLFSNKAVAMAISAALTAMVGTAWARYSSFVDPYQFSSPLLTIQIVLIATIGGLGTPLGPLLAACLLVPFGEIVRGHLGGALPGLHSFIYGVLIVAVILLMPQGLVPALLRLSRRAAGGAGKQLQKS
jgi:branched-chain amino acid transport system permease protein